MYNDLLLDAPPWTVRDSKGDSLESVIMSVVGAYHNGSNELEVLLHLDWYE